MHADAAHENGDGKAKQSRENDSRVHAPLLETTEPHDRGEVVLDSELGDGTGGTWGAVPSIDDDRTGHPANCEQNARRDENRHGRGITHAVARYHDDRIQLRARMRDRMHCGW